MTKIRQAVISIIFILIFVSRGFAQDSIQNELMLERIQYIENALQQSEKHVNNWWNGWLYGYSAATLVQSGVSIFSKDIATKQDMALGAVTTLLGAGFQLITPINTSKDAKYILQLPASNSIELSEKLKVAENLFKSNAMKEKAGRSWQIHALNEAVNLSSGLITWLGFKRSIWEGVSNFLMNSVITEVQILTQPTKTYKDYQKYLQKYKSTTNAQLSEFHPEYFLKTYPGGVSLSIVF